MSRTKSWLAALAVLGMAVTPVNAQERADTVRLRFDWSDGTRARVESTRRQESATETTRTLATGADYRLSVSRHPEGLLVSYDDFRFPASTDTSGGLDMAVVAQRAAAMVPQLVVSSAGEFLRINDVASILSALDSMLVEVLGPEDAAQTREMMAQAMSEESLTGMAAQEWNAIVGMWIEADLEMGATYQLQDHAPVPIIPGAVVPMISEFSVQRRTSCTEAGTATDCVEIHLVSFPDPDSLGAVISQFMQQLLALPGAPPFTIESLDVENEMVLVTEPSTLRPHRVRLSRSVKGVLTAAGEREEMSQVDVRSYRYRYEDRER